jgi:hypothetical protein
MIEPKFVVCIWDDWHLVRQDEVALSPFKPVRDVVYQVRNEFMGCLGNGQSMLCYHLAELVNPPVYNHILKCAGEPSFASCIFREVRFAKKQEVASISEDA